MFEDEQLIVVVKVAVPKVEWEKWSGRRERERFIMEAIEHGEYGIEEVFDD